MTDAAERAFRQLLNTAPVMIWISGADKLCTWFNKPWLEFTGRTLAQERGDGWTRGVHPEDIERCLELYASHFDRRLPFRMEYRLRRADGAYRWILDSGVPRYTNDGVFQGYIGSGVDIDAAKNVQGVSHELGNLVCSFLASLWFIRKDADDARTVRRLASEAEQLAIEAQKLTAALNRSGANARARKRAASGL